MRHPSFFTFVIWILGALYAAALLAYLYLPYELRGGRTRFAPDFSEFAFQTIRDGQTMARVRAALGRPLRSERLPRIETWVFAPQDWFGAPNNLFLPKPTVRRMIAPMLSVFFDAQGLVSGAFGELREQPPAGMDRSELFIHYGLPVYELSRPEMIAEDYALPDGSPVYKVRRVLYDADRRVVGIRGFTHLGAIRPVPPEADGN